MLRSYGGFELADFLALLVEEIIGNLVGQRGTDRRVLPLNGVGLDLPEGAQGGVLEGGPRSPAFTVGAARIADFLDGGLLFLPGQLQDAEFGNPGQLNARPVEAQGLLERLFHLRLVLAVPHIDEVDGDEPSQVAQAELAGDFLGGLHVGLEGRFLDIALVRAAAGIDVDRDHGLGGVEHDITAGLEVGLLLVDDADLLFQAEAVEQRRLVLVVLDHLQVAGRHGPAVGPHLPEGFEIVHKDFLDVRGEVIPQRADAEIGLLVDQRGGRQFCGGLQDLFPQAGEVLVVPGQFLLGPAHARGADDVAEAFVDLDLADEFLELPAVFLVFDLARNAPPGFVGQQDEIPSRQGDVGGEERPFALPHLPENLDDHFLTDFQGGAAVVLAVVKILRIYVAQGKEPVLLAAVIHEGSLESPLHFLHDSLVDIAVDGVADGHLDVELHQFAVIQDGHPFLLRMHGIDQHFLFHKDPSGNSASAPGRARVRGYVRGRPLPSPSGSPARGPSGSGAHEPCLFTVKRRRRRLFPF